MAPHHLRAVYAAAGAATFALKIAASSPQFDGAVAWVSITVLVTLAFIVVGGLLLFTDVPPVNAWGCLLVALASVPGDLNDPHYVGTGLSGVGFVLEPVYLAAAAALVLRYPQPTLTRPARLVVGALLAVGFLTRLGAAMTIGPAADDFYRPEGAPYVDLPSLWHDLAFVRVGRAVVCVLLLAVTGILTVRFQRTRGLARQARAPVLLIGGLCAVGAAADQLVWAVGPDLIDLPGAIVRNLTAAILPFALLADLLRRRAAGAAVARHVYETSRTGSLERVQEVIRDVLADPSAAVQVPTPAGGWSSATGTLQSSLGAEDPRHGRVEIRDDDGILLMRLTFDPRAVDDEQLIASCVSAVRAGASNHRLHADLVASLSELRASRERIVAAGLEERRRVERNLHDGAQQQFLAVAATLAQADFVGDADVRALVRDARTGLREGLTELRALARGIHPPHLQDGGLTAALSNVAHRSPLDVTCQLDPQVDHVGADVSSTAYFVVAELLTNAARHSGVHQAVLTARAERDGITLSVSDAGRGGATLTTHGGLTGLRDRVEAMGGQLDIAEASQGTNVTVWLPRERVTPK
ncbi:ATP-binding protein [Terrabacter sp. Ter38]|uniref:sensor histidine kinase n=1 Tax=Terrabacter sp. Ter38 TaxID=2926030 RepID=UPI0021181A99|nr:ATP-binding protein [Terrabacter sp. Ter38]